jgi:hypothetical protein
MDDDQCWLVALPYRGLSVILSLLRYAEWRARWRPVDDMTWQQVEDFINQIEGCLLMGCRVEDLIITQRLLIGAITGGVVNLDEPLPETGIIDFSQSGLATKFLSSESEPRNVADILANLQANLADLQTAVAEGDLEDDLANVWGQLQTVATILGATVGAPPIPL